MHSQQTTKSVPHLSSEALVDRRCLLLPCAALAALLAPAPGAAHTISLDGSATEWFAVTAPAAGFGRVARRPDGAGEYAWSDPAGDQRAAWPSRPHDLTEFRVTGDRDHLYFMARLGGPVATAGDSVPQLQVSIETASPLPVAALALADPEGFPAAGAHARLVRTRFASGRPPVVLDGAGAEAGAGVAALSADGVLEVAVPWSALGLRFAPADPLRLAVALFLTGAGDAPLDPGDGLASRAADVVTQNGGPGAPGSTAAELADGGLDYGVPLWFDGRGEVVAPLVVNEIYFGVGVRSQWVELVNPTQSVLALDGFKLGDEEQPGGNEGFAHFPAGLVLAPGQAFVAARSGSQFLSENGLRAGAECDGSDALTADMLAFPEWAGDTAFNLSTGGDEVLVLDPANTVVDAVSYRNGAFPGLVPHPGTTGARSLVRVNPSQDTDDCAADFGEAASPTPGSTTTVAAVGDGAARGPVAFAPPAPNPAHGRVALALRLAREDDVRVDVFDASGRLVRELWRGRLPAGEARLAWDGRDGDGRPVAAGLYLLHAAAGGGSARARVAIVR